MSMPEVPFTMTQFLEHFGLDVEVHLKSKLASKAIGKILRERGYTQRVIKANGLVMRAWSNKWETPSVQDKGDKFVDVEMLEEMLSEEIDK